MTQQNDNRHQAIDRSVIILGLVAGAVLYVSVGLLVVEYLNGASGLSMHDLLSISR